MPRTGGGNGGIDSSSLADNALYLPYSKYPYPFLAGSKQFCSAWHLPKTCTKILQKAGDAVLGFVNHSSFTDMNDRKHNNLPVLLLGDLPKVEVTQRIFLFKIGPVRG